jgi:uncharacterized protein
MFKASRPLLALLWLIGLSLSVPAVALDLYQGEVSVANQTAEARQEALGRALLEVVVKVSGDAKTAQSSSVRSAMSGADRMIQRYEYRQELVRENGKAVVKLYLKGTFYPASVNALLSRSGFAAFGAERPIVAVYLFEDGAPIAGDVQRGMTDRASRRGIDLRFPAGVSLADVGDLKSAAERLGTRQMNAMVGVVGQAMWVSDGKTSEALTSAELDGTTDRMAQLLTRRWSQASNAAPETIEVAIQGINSAARYSKAVQYLAALKGVKKMQVKGGSAGALRAELSVLGGAEGLQESLQSSKVMLLPSTEDIDGILQIEML